jgi:hypothetical protein
MQANVTYPRWFHGFRGLLVGLTLGCAATVVAYELNAVPTGRVWAMLFPLIGAAPAMILLPFEAYFAIRSYRTIRREMDGRSRLA